MPEAETFLSFQRGLGAVAKVSEGRFLRPVGI